MPTNNNSSKNLDSFKDSLKATSFLGSIQVIGIVISIVRSKLIAVLLGPYGMGLIGMFQNAVSMISSLTNLGLGVSAVKDISEANESGDAERVSLVISVFNKLVMVTGLVGALICCIFCKQISIITFGVEDYKYGFLLLSLMILLTQLTLGRTTKLQGLRKYKYLASSNILGNAIGLVVVIPLYYLYGASAIVFGLVLGALILFATSEYYSKKVYVANRVVSIKEVWQHGNGMVKMGFFIGLNSIMAALIAYVLNIFIAQIGCVDDVGLYAAGYAIVEGYVGMVFTSVGTDYYPRLSAIHHDKEKFNKVINNQIEIVLLVLGPLVAIFIIYSKLLIELLYSGEFMGIESFLIFAMLAMMFRGVGVLLDYCFLVKSDTKLFFYNSLSMKVYTTLLNLLFYYLWGIDGLGYSILLGFVLNTIQVSTISICRYGYSVRRDLTILFIWQLFLSSICVVLTHGGYLLRYGVGSAFILMSAFISYHELRKQVDIKALFKLK